MLIRRTNLALGVVVAGFSVLGVSVACSADPLSHAPAAETDAAAQNTTHSTDTTDSNQVAHEKDLERRVDELQRELEQVQSELRASVRPLHKAQAPEKAKQEALPAFSSGPGISVALHGWVDVTAFSQSRPFASANGQSAEWPAPGGHGKLSGVAANNTRLQLTLTGPQIMGDWDTGAYVSMDFFGGYNGTGPFSSAQQTPRMRLAYVKLHNERTSTTVLIGQYWGLLATAPTLPAISLSHLAVPLGSGIGNLGWRFPGVVLFQGLGHPAPGAASWRLDVGVYSGQWNGPGSNINFESAGNVGFRPQVEARISFGRGKSRVYLTGYYSKKDLRGVGQSAVPAIQSSLVSHAVQLAGVWVVGKASLRGEVYSGRGLGEVFGTLTQFGDIRDRGGWIQGGYNWTPHVSTYLAYSTSRPNKTDVLRWTGHGASGLFDGQQETVGVMWRQSPFSAELEFMHSTVHQQEPNVSSSTLSAGNAVYLSGFYRF